MPRGQKVEVSPQLSRFDPDERARLFADTSGLPLEVFLPTRGDWGPLVDDGMRSTFHPSRRPVDDEDLTIELAVCPS